MGLIKETSHLQLTSFPDLPHFLLLSSALLLPFPFVTVNATEEQKKRGRPGIEANLQYI